MYILKNLIKWCVLLINELICYFLPKNKNLIIEDKIVFVRLDNIGDFIIWLHSLSNLKQEMRRLNKKSVLICNAAVKELAIETTLFDEIIPINIKKFNLNLNYKYKVLKSLRKRKFYKVVSPIYSRNIATEGIIKNILSNKKIGIDGDLSNITKFQKIFTNKNYSELILLESYKKMELYKNLEIFNKIFNSRYKLELYELKLNNNYINIKEKYCVFFIGASDVRKCWELAKFIEVAKNLKMRIVISGGKSEVKLVEKFMEDISILKIGNIENLVGKTNLVETAILIKNSEFILTNDTFATHMATILKKKSICILGGGHFGRFLPYPQELNKNSWVLPKVIFKKMDCFGCNWRCKYKQVPWRCIKEINQDNIIKLVKL